MESTEEPCGEKTRVLVEYKEATQACSSAVGDLAHVIGIVPLDEEYQRLNRAVDRSRRKLEDARNRRARHIAEDHC